MYDLDMDAARWKSYRRALKHLFKLLYGEWPTLKVSRVNDELFPYLVTIESSTAKCSIHSATKTDCFSYLLDRMHDKIDNASRDWDEDEWLRSNQKR